MRFKNIIFAVIVIATTILVLGCETEKGPISVDTEMKPSVAKDGEHITLKVKVTNHASGGEIFKQAEPVTIKQILWHEEFASGPQQYMGAILKNQFPNPSTKSVAPGSTEIILSKTFSVENTDYEKDLKIKGFVEVETYSGGSDKDEFMYTVEHR